MLNYYSRWSYHGNGETMTSVVGSEVELPYNMNGEDLFGK